MPSVWQPSQPPFDQWKAIGYSQARKAHFQESCIGCHSGPYHTDQKQYKVPWTTGHDKGLSMDVPALSECWRTAPYLYDGRSSSMNDMLKIHGPAKEYSQKEMDELKEYVLSL